MSNTLVITTRRITQLFVILVLVLSPLLQLVRTFRQDPYPYPRSPVIEKQQLRKLVAQSDHKVRDRLDTIYEGLSGGPYTIRIFPLHFSEPLTISLYSLNNIFQSGFWNWTVLVTLILALSMALLLGRVYCGYVCPMSILVTWNIRLQQRLFKRFLRYSGSWRRRQNKGQKVFVFVLAILLIANPLLVQYLLPPSLFQHAWSDYILFGGWSLWLLLLAFLFIFELALPGYFCRRLCPTGTFLSICGLKKRVHLYLHSQRECLPGCKKCIDVCWLGLTPKTKTNDPACDLCGRCAEICPQSRIQFFAPLLLVLFSMAYTPPVLAGQWDTQESDFAYIAEKVYWEGRHTVALDPDNEFRFFYSVYGPSNKGKKELNFHLHIQKQGKLYDKEVVIHCRTGNRTLSTASFSAPNFPISIRQRSVFKLPFEFEENVKYSFEFSSPNGDFAKQKVSFVYPELRR